MKRAILVLVLTALGARGEAPAWLSLDHLAAKANEAVDVTLDASMLQLAGKFLSGGKKDEAQAKSLIEGVKAIYVRSFEFAGKGEYTAADLKPLRTHLQSPGWARLMGAQNKSGGESAELFSRTEGGQMTGFAIVATEPKELTVVYIEGTIDLARLAELSGSFGIPRIHLPPGTVGPHAVKKGSK